MILFHIEVRFSPINMQGFFNFKAKCRVNFINYVSQSMLWWSVAVKKYETCYPF